MANTLKFVSAIFVLFFYPPKSTHAKFLSELICSTRSVLKRKILLFNKLNWELYRLLMWYIFSNFVENCSFSFIKVMGIKITYFLTSKISSHKIIKTSPPTKINPSKKWKNVHLRKLITQKFISPKINLRKVVNAKFE